MNLGEYQIRAAETLVPQRGDPVSFFILGLTGEIGTIAAQYKKRLRDGAAHEAFLDQIAEEMGDVLWYLASLATALGVDLDEAAERNLAKVHDRWLGSPAQIRFDDGFPESESLPRQLEITFLGIDDTLVMVDSNGEQIGDRLTDNSHYADGYRFHDIIHLANAAVLGWSPTVRALLKRKRKSDKIIDEVEDGARAIFTEEGIATAIFSYAAKHRFLEGLERVDSELLAFIQTAVANLEVAAVSASDWESAILQAFQVWRYLDQNDGGRVLVDLDAQAITFLPPVPALDTAD